VQRTATIAAYLDNQEIADDALQGLAKNEIVAAVLLTSSSGKRYSFGQPESQPEKNAMRVALESPFTAGEQVGVLTIYPQQQLIQQNARDAALSRALLLGGYTLAIALLVMVLIQWQFIPVFRQIADTLHNIEPGSEQRLSLPAQHKNNEIGALVGDINELLDVVKEKLDNEKSLRREIENLSRRFRLIYERASVGLLLIDRDTHVVMANSAFYKMLNVLGVTASSEDPLPIEAIFDDESTARELLNSTLASGAPAQADLQLKVKGSSTTTWVHCLFTRILDDQNHDDQVLAQLILSDITDRKQEELRIRQQAELDPLTQLYNRRATEQALRLLLEKNRFESSRLAACLIDLDDFKPINDSYGHQAGDVVLTTLAARMHNFLRENDIAARLGGDEFLIVITGIANREAIELVARKVLVSLTQPIDLGDGRQVNVGISMGIVLHDHGSVDPAKLIDRADGVMYKIKNTGKHGFHIDDMNDMSMNPNF
jgi:diguanylate cyclase (GGDEF)-like protein